MELPSILQQLQAPLMFTTLILTQGFKPGVFRIFLTLPVMIILWMQSLYRQEFMYYGEEYPMNIMACVVMFYYLDQIILANPDKEKWHKIHYKTGGEEGEKSMEGDFVPQTYWKRVWWAIRIATTARYVGWSQQVKNVAIEVQSDYPRWLFIVRKSLRAAFFFIVSDTVQSWTASTPHGAYRGFENGKIIVGLSNLPLQQRFIFAWVQIVITYTCLELYNSLYGIVSVLSGLANPRDCPSSFGDLKQLYTVRQGWSLVWHQQCRRNCSSPSIYLARDVLHLKKGGFASKYVQLYIGFIISGIIHGGGAMLSHKSFEDDAALVCFFLQATGIMVEDHVINLGKYMGFKDSMAWRMVGYVWTISWFGLSMMIYTSGIVRNGIWIHAKQVDFFGVGPRV